MKIAIEGSAKEIAALVLALQERQELTIANEADITRISESIAQADLEFRPLSIKEVLEKNLSANRDKPEEDS